MSFPQVVGQVVVDLRQEPLGVVGVEAQNLLQALQADVLQVTVGQSLHAGVGLDHLRLGQTVGANQVASACRVLTGQQVNGRVQEHQDAGAPGSWSTRMQEHQDVGAGRCAETTASTAVNV